MILTTFFLLFLLTTNAKKISHSHNHQQEENERRGRGEKEKSIEEREKGGEEEVYKTLIPLDFKPFKSRHGQITPPIHIFSSFYDTRPLLFERETEIVVVGSIVNAKDDQINLWQQQKDSLSCLVARRSSSAVNRERDLVVDPLSLQIVFASPATSKVLGSHPRQQVPFFFDLIFNKKEE